MKSSNKVVYAMGSLGATLFYLTFTSRAQFLYVDEIGIDPGIYAIILIFYGIWNAINDPLMGQLSDNTRSDSGRRIPYIRYGAIPLAIFFFLIWIPPRQSPEWVIVAYFVVVVFIFDTLWTLVVLAWTALFPEMFPGLEERSVVSGWRQVFTILGLLIALGATPILIDSVGLVPMAIGYSVIAAGAFLISLRGSFENPDRLEEKTLPFGEALKVTLSNLSFRWFLVANLAKEVVFLMLPAIMPFYAKYVIRLSEPVWGLDAALQEAMLLAVPFLLSVPGMLIWTKVTQRIGSRKAWVYASWLFMPGLVLMFIASDFVMAITGTTLLVLGMPGILMLYDLLIADIVDEDQLGVGYRREGMFFGMNGAAIRLAFVIQGIFFGLTSIFTGYEAGLDVQPDAAVWGFRFLIAGVPLLSLLVTIWALRHYPLHGERLLAVRAQLKARR